MRSQFRQLKLSDRYVIYNMLRHLKKLTDIAIALNVHKSTISREIKRNSHGGKYDPEIAQKQHERRTRQARYVKSFADGLWQYIKEHLENGHSPDAIAGRLKYHPNKLMHISHQTIYNWVRKKIAGNSLARLLLFGKKGYRKQNKPVTGAEKRRIDEMPEISRDRTRRGDFEGDLIIGSQHRGAILTLVDRMSSFILAGKLPNRSNHSLATTLRDLFADFDNDKLRTLVFDNEGGMNDFKTIEEILQIKVYFTYPGRPWEKAVIENSNRLLRRFFPKYLRLDIVDPDSIRQAVEWLNNYPRKKYNYRSPLEVFYGITQVAFAI